MAKSATALALLAGTGAFLGLLGAHFRIVPPMVGFTLFAASGLLGGLLTALLGAGAMFLGRGGRNPDGFRLGAASTAVGVGLLLVIFVAATPGRGLPPINDISTDLESPPEFLPATVVPEFAGRDMRYPEAFVPQVREAYPDLAPIRLETPPRESFSRALAVAEAAGWTIAASSPEQGVFNARDETRLFRFVDDIAVRVTPDGAGARIDVRSKSRDGRGDLGANAARIRAYAAAFE